MESLGTADSERTDDKLELPPSALEDAVGFFGTFWVFWGVLGFRAASGCYKGLLRFGFKGLKGFLYGIYQGCYKGLGFRAA